MQVSLFVTCLAETFYPRAAIAVVKVLEHLGCEVDFPSAQTCCGQPQYNNGFHAETADLARRMIRIFEHSGRVVTPSGSCAAMVRDYYPELLHDDPAYAQGARELADKTFEFIEFLVNDMRVDFKSMNLRWSGTVTYHYSCHLRGLGVTNEAEQVIEAIGDLDYRPLRKKEQCCGFGGTFAVKYPEISGTMVRDKVQCIGETGADYVISNDSGCTMNLAGSCRRESAGVRFITLAEILAESMGLLDPAERDERDEAAPASSATASST